MLQLLINFFKRHKPQAPTHSTTAHNISQQNTESIEMDKRLTVLQRVFQDNKPRTVLGHTPFGDILFHEANGKGTTYKALQIYARGAVASAPQPIIFQLHVIGETEKDYQRLINHGGQPHTIDLEELYHFLFHRNGLLSELANIKPKPSTSIYLADRNYYSSTNSHDIQLYDFNDFYEMVLAYGKFNEDTLHYDLTEIDKLEDKPAFYIQKLYWGYGISRDANGLYNCINLQNLSVWSEHAAYLNENIAQLQNLSVLSVTSIDAHSDYPQQFLDNIHRLSHLVSLSLGADAENNQYLAKLKELPVHLNQLSQLKYLSLAGNLLTNCQGIRNTTLHTLDLSTNQLNNIDGIGKLTHLESLNLSNNQLTALPQEILQLKRLKSLNVSKNPLLIVPDWLFEMDALEELNLEQTQLKTLPAAVQKLTRMQSLKLKKNPFESLPPRMASFPKKVISLELRNMALYDAKAKTKLAQYPSGDHLFEADFNFKLMVINQLMYVDEVLLPKFDVWQFAEQRGIDIEKVGYNIIPEVVEYFKQLPIPMALLIDIEELEADGGDKIYGQVFPFWSGETEEFNVQSVADVVHLPRLKRTNNAFFNSAQIKELRNLKIKVSQY